MNTFPHRLCFLDLETTGFDPEKDSIIELSFVVTNQKGEELCRFDQLIQPEKSPLNPFVSELTGITQNELDTQAQPLETYKAEILEKIGEAVIVGHNIDFDINFLEAYGIPVKQNGRIDTHELARIILLQEESYALEILAQKYGFKHENAHRAMSDVEVNIDIFWFLQEQAETLSAEFLAEIKPILLKHSWWKEGLILLQSTQKLESPYRIKNQLPTSNVQSIDISEIKAHHQVAIRAGDTKKTAAIQQSLAHSFQQSVIVSSKFDRFTEESFFPTPEVLLDPKKLTLFLQKDFSKSIEITFAIQCAWRQHLGFRGKTHFDLFLHQYQLWNHVCCQDEKNEVFQNIVKQRSDTKVLIISPAAFLRFIDLPIFKHRTIIIDEAESFGAQTLHAPTHTISLLPYLHHSDDTISTKAQFWVSNFCQEVIRAKTGHEISPFPTKLLLKDTETFIDFADSAQDFIQPADSKLIEMLSQPKEKETRWINYNPKKGELTFSCWHPENWRTLKEKINQKQTILFHRHQPSESYLFFRVFLGISAPQVFDFESLHPSFSWEVPNNLISNRSPEYADFCAQSIAQIAQEKTTENHFVVASFTSLETLKNAYLKINETLKESALCVFGERVKGGKGKMFEMMKQSSPFTLLLQKISDKRLEAYPFKTLVLQRIPFPAPHPLLEKIEQVMKQSNQNFWDAWVQPQVAAALSRKTSDFEQLETVICLDGRENARWAKPILQSAWPHLKKQKF